MKLVIEYDPYGETKAAKSAQTAFQTLGIPVEVRELRFNYHRAGAEDAITPVKFEGQDKVTQSPDDARNPTGKT